MNLLEIIIKMGIKLFYYFTDGAKIAAAVEWNGSKRMPREKIIKEGATRKFEGGKAFFEESDITTRWELESFGTLILKNNSKNFAYNIVLTNASSIFSTINPIGKLASLGPNDKIEIPISFRQFVIEDNGILADSHAGIPKSIQDRYLVIQYENEAGIKMLTKSYIDFEKIDNIYTTL